MEVLRRIRETIPDFDFSKCDRILKLQISQSAPDRLSIEACMQCAGSYEVELLFSNAWNIQACFDGGAMHLGEFFIAPLEDVTDAAHGFRAWDELLAFGWKCEDVLLLRISTIGH